MTIEEAKSIKLTDYLHTIGSAPCKQQNNNLWYLSPFRAESEPSFKVTFARNEWYDFGIGKGGNLIALVGELHQVSDATQILRILDGKPITPSSFSFRKQESFQSFEDISVKPLANVALIQFLNERNIPTEIARQYCKEVYYKHNGKLYFVIGFENNKKGYEIRNKYFKGCISPKDIIHLWNCNRSCCLFEGFMDYLSFHAICRQKGVDTAIYDAIVLNSVGNISKALPLFRNYEKVHAYLDNDTAGQSATVELHRLLGNKLTDHSHAYREYKDLNDYLCGQKLEKKLSNNPVANSEYEPPKRKRGFRL